MAGWIVLSVLLLLIFLIFFLPYGVDILYKKECLQIGVKAGPIRVRILPRRPSTEKQLLKKEKKQAKKEAKKAAKAEKKATAVSKMDETIQVKKKKPLNIDLLFALLEMAAHAIRRFFRSFTISIFRFYFCAASKDPYYTSVEYGYACALAEALPELCGNVIHVKKREVVIDADYTAEEPSAELYMACTLQLFKIVYVGIAFAAEFIAWKIKHRSNNAENKERVGKNGRE